MYWKQRPLLLWLMQTHSMPFNKIYLQSYLINIRNRLNGHFDSFHYFSNTLFKCFIIRFSSLLIITLVSDWTNRCITYKFHGIYYSCNTVHIYCDFVIIFIQFNISKLSFQERCNIQKFTLYIFRLIYLFIWWTMAMRTCLWTR